MKKTFFILCAVFGVSVAMSASVLAVEIGGEHIANYDVNITVQKDAQIKIIETIDYDFGVLTRHGIYRDIPIKYKTGAGNNRRINIDNISVYNRSGGEYLFTTQKQGNNLRIKIGDAQMLVTGAQTYVISYTIADALNSFDTHDELYWNAIGGEWNVPIQNATVRVHVPQLNRAQCFAGVSGSNTECTTIAQNETSVEFAQTELGNGKNMTIVVAIAKGIIAMPTWWQYALQFVHDNGIVVLPVVVAWVMYRRWRKYGKDPQGRHTIVPHYAAPDQLPPMYVGAIVDERVQTQHIGAMIIDLAVRGYLKVVRSQKEGFLGKMRSADYTLIKLREVDDRMTQDEKKFLEELWSFSDDVDGIMQVKLSDLRNKFASSVSQVTTIISKQLVERKIFVKRPQVIRAKYIGVGAVLFFVGIIFASIFSSAVIFGSALVSSIIISIFGWYMPQRTAHGVKLREQILGLKMYMDVAEKDRINFHNAPEKNPELFEKLLPYAMVLGVEKEWLTQFEDLLTQDPQWYEGGAGAFVATDFAQDIGAFASSASSVTTSQTSSGGSGFSSGRSGGGFGGGGGGSW